MKLLLTQGLGAMVEGDEGFQGLAMVIFDDMPWMTRVC